jgi:hypothetical protein
MPLILLALIIAMRGWCGSLVTAFLSFFATIRISCYRPSYGWSLGEVIPELPLEFDRLPTNEIDFNGIFLDYSAGDYSSLLPGEDRRVVRKFLTGFSPPFCVFSVGKWIGAL